MLDTILPMLFVNRAAATNNVNSLSANPPEAHIEVCRRPTDTPEEISILLRSSTLTEDPWRGS